MLACSFHPATADAPTVILFHGNGEVVCDYLGGFANWFAWLGWNLLLAEYRGYGMSTGEPQLGRMLDDVVHVVQATRTLPERIGALGRSVGSIFALEAAARFPSLAGVILESGVADPLERLLLRLQPRVGAAFRWEMNKSVLFTEDAEALPNLGSSRVLVNSVSKLSAKVLGPMAVGVGFTVNYDSEPAAQKIPWDTTLAITLDYLL